MKQALGLPLALLALIVGFGLTSEYFLTRDTFIAIANDIPEETFRSCYLQGRAVTRVLDDLSEGFAVRVRSTPTYFVDGVNLSCRLLPVDNDEPRLVARRGGTQLPEAHTVDEAKDAAREAIMESLPKEIARKGEHFSLTLEHRGRLFIPYWVAYYQGSRLDVYDFLVLDADTGDVNDDAKDIVDRGFLMLDQMRIKAQPCFDVIRCW